MFGCSDLLFPCLCRRIDAHLCALLPPVDQWNNIKPLAGMCFVSVVFGCVSLCVCKKKKNWPILGGIKKKNSTGNLLKDALLTCFLVIILVILIIDWGQNPQSSVQAKVYSKVYLRLTWGFSCTSLSNQVDILKVIFYPSTAAQQVNTVNQHNWF